jgi:hypothetical protein
MKSILKSLKFMALFTSFFLYIILCILGAMFATFAPFGATMLLNKLGCQPAMSIFGGFLVVFSYVIIAEKLGHLDDLHL